MWGHDIAVTSTSGKVIAEVRWVQLIAYLCGDYQRKYPQIE